VSLPEFVHFSPRSLDEASGLLMQYGDQARVLAGGTDLLVKMKQRRLVPRYVVNIKRIRDLDYIAHEPGKALRIGALTTLETLNRSVVVRKTFAVLHDAVSSMGTLEIRNRGTLAGNVCNASPAAETVPALMLLGARATLVGRSGSRSVALDSLFAAPGRTVLCPGELLTEIQIPEPDSRAFGAYDKFSLRRMDLAVVGAAAALEFEDGICRKAAIVLSAVAPTARRMQSAAAMLEGRAIDERLIDDAAHEAAAQANPRTDLWGTVDYKRNAAAALVTRVVKRALERAGRREPS